MLSVPHGNHMHLLQLYALKIISTVLALHKAGNVPGATPRSFSRHQRDEKTSLFPSYVFFVSVKLKAKPSGGILLT